MKRLLAGFVIVVLSGLLIWAIYSTVSAVSSHLEKKQEQTTQKNSITIDIEKKQADEKKEERQSAWGVGFAFLILSVALIIVVAISWTGGWRLALTQPTYVAIYAMFVLNVLAFLFTYPAWRWFYNHQILFWGVNIGFILFVFFFTRQHMRLVAYGIGVFLVLGLLNATFGNNDKPAIKSSASNKNVTPEITPMIFEIPVETTVERDIPIGYDFNWGGSEGSFVVENEKGIKARFDPKNNLFEDLPWINEGEKSGFSKRLKFKSFSDKPAKVNLQFTKQIH
jgi:hypothetical protein